ncbi:MAG TPA: bifunctional aspartate kinase/homoserine dehydrogenase I [Gammaproteobacteria bacterium]|nr:bifunctional aspartate kinase/homoserine dehydrogenase I [Gammaproteobacteria bacterium]
MGWMVHKFGGTSLADAGCFRRVARIVESGPRVPTVVVVSAMGGLTDALFSIIDLAASGSDPTDALAAIRSRHAEAAADLLPPEAAAAFLADLDKDLGDIRNVLDALSLVRSASHRSRDLITGYGEIWSARLLAAYLERSVGASTPVRYVNARDVVTIEHGEMGPIVRWEESRQKCIDVLVPGEPGIRVVTGYIASDAQGLPTTLGRNGSDYSASIFARLLDADAVTIWTDVGGVMSGDPRLVPEAKVIEGLTYNEAMELAYFGAKVIHPQTMAPAIAGGIPIQIRNTFAPDAPGTRIAATAALREEVVKGVSAFDGVALINLEGAGMIGVPGTADRLFGALRTAGISVMLISQGSSEHSICFAVREEAAESVREVVEAAFAVELAQGQVQRVEVTPACAIIAVVGDGMSGLPGSAGKFFRTLGNSGINVRAIAQGASERNISAVIGARDMTKALRAVHSSFYLSAKTVSIGVIGPGSVGSALIDQLAAACDRLREKFKLDLRIRAIAKSQRMCLAASRIDLDNWRAAIDAGEAIDLDALTEHVQTDYLPHAVMIDCTASQEIADRYLGWLGRGIHVITPNKRAHSGPRETYAGIKRVSHASNTHFLYEATVGAGLPVINTLKDLVETGDDIARISGIFSGTLAYLFNVFDGSKPFSSIVRDANDRGYTEPDPRDDLSGMDVARKAVILAREAGLDLELADIEVESLVPAALAGAPVDEFLDRLVDFDAPMAEKLAEARAARTVLRYVAEVDLDGGSAVVELKAFPLDHPFANIALTDNIVQFVTRRYSDNPLIVRGPGAGPDVTAAGIFADLLRLCSMLSGHDD